MRVTARKAKRTTYRTGLSAASAEHIHVPATTGSTQPPSGGTFSRCHEPGFAITKSWNHCRGKTLLRYSQPPTSRIITAVDEAAAPGHSRRGPVAVRGLGGSRP